MQNPKGNLPIDPDVTIIQKLKFFFTVHWRGVLTLIVPLAAVFIILPLPGLKWQWVAYCLAVMATFWVTECIPLQVTAFLPIIIFPVMNVMDNNAVAKCYMQDTTMVFLGSLILASSVEHSGFHKRLAYRAVMIVGYSHSKLLLAVCCVTAFASMWCQNTACTVMMVPILFALLNVFEAQGVMNIYDTTLTGEKVASRLTTMYFCAVAFSSSVEHLNILSDAQHGFRKGRSTVTALIRFADHVNESINIGGIGTLIGTGTNLVFKGLYETEHPEAPEYLSFPLFSAFGVPSMLVLETALYLNFAICYLGMFRPNSAAAQRAHIPENVRAQAKTALKHEAKKLGNITYWECMVVILFGGAMSLFFSRSPHIFKGWGDMLQQYYLKENSVVFDSSVAMFVATLMVVLPSNLNFFKNFSATYIEDAPSRPITSILDWDLLNKSMPYSFMFLLGGGFALSRAATRSGFNKLIGETMSFLKDLPNPLIIFIIIASVSIVTNFASNVAVCNVFTPISMSIAQAIGQNDLWYCIASGFTCSFTFLLPVGTPPNLIVQSAAKIPTLKMIQAGLLPTLTTAVLFFLMVYFVAPLIWDLN